MLIDNTYFFGEILIGQLSEQSVQDKLTLFINQFEPEILQGLLGYETYKLMTAALAVTDPAPAAGDIWYDLKNGAEYTDQYGILRKWKGFVQAAGAKESLIAYYVYYWYQKSQASSTMGTGEAKAQTQNAVGISPKYKMTNAWNKMVSLNFELYDFLNAKKDNYPQWYTWAITYDTNLKFFHSINSFNLI